MDCTLVRRHAHGLREQARRQQALIWLEPETTWLARNAPEVDNLRAAMDWGAAHEPGLAVALVGASFHLFSRLALLHENRQLAEALLPLIDTLDLPTDDLADFLRAHIRHLRDSSITALHAAAQRAASLFRHSGNRHGLYQTLFSIASAFRGFEAQASAAAQEMAAIEHADWPKALRASA